jgi:ABC-type sugar transport system ATPase subunit
MAEMREKVDTVEIVKSILISHGNPENVIQVRYLVKNYGNFTAVCGVSFNVEKGEVFALLGPNGAGKTR